MPVDATESVCVPDYPIWGAGSDLPEGLTVLANGTVTHSLTGLMWQQDATSAGGKLTWGEAMQYCQALDLGGYSDWRLPSGAELTSIMAIAQSIEVMDSDLPFEPKLSDKRSVWTGSPDRSDPTRAWILKSNYAFNPVAKSTPGNVRCVRGVSPVKEPQPRFVFPSSGQVNDLATGLTWHQCSISAELAYDDSPSLACKGKNTGLPGSGWRLPTIRELESLVVRERSPAFDTSVFVNFPSAGTHLRFWSSSQEFDGSGDNYVIDFKDGAMYSVGGGCQWCEHQSGAHVMCVR